MASINRTARAAWQSTGKEGTGQLTTQSGVLKEARYGFQTRFADGPGTNPEELIAAPPARRPPPPRAPQAGVRQEARHGFQPRFAGGPGTNPEELIAASHAGCFTMALAFQLSGAGHTPQSLNTAPRGAPARR